MEKIHSEETATDRAVRNLEKAFDESADLSAEEIEEEILSIPGVEKGAGLEKMKKKSGQKREKKETIH